MSAAWLELKFRPAKRGTKGYDVIDLSQLPTKGEVTLGFVWRRGQGWAGKALLPDGREVLVQDAYSPDGTYGTRVAAAKDVDVRVAQEPDIDLFDCRPVRERQLAEQGRLVFGGRR